MNCKIYSIKQTKFQDALLDHNANNFFLDARDKKDFERTSCNGC